MDSWPKLINTGSVSKGLHYKGGVEDGKDSAKGGVIGGDFQWTAPAFLQFAVHLLNDVAENWV